MYQKQQIIFYKDSTEAKKFYEEQIKGYISYLESNIVTYEKDGETFEDRVNFTVSEDEQDNTVTITIDEDWTLIFRNLKFVSEDRGDECKYGMLLRAYLSADDATKKAVRFRYAHRTVKECDMNYYTNLVKVFDSANMNEPIMVRSDYSWYEPLPVENVIDLNELPDKKWYPARTWIEIIRCNGMCFSHKPVDFDLLTQKEMAELEDGYDSVPISDEIVELVKQNERYIEEFESIEGAFSIPSPDDYVELVDENCFGEYHYMITDPGIMTTSELIEFIGKIDSFRKNCEYVNEKCGYDISNPSDTLQRISLMMYSDDFDIIETIVNESGQIVCRFYENGNTSVVYSEKVLKRNKVIEEKREQNIESQESYEALSETEKMLFNAKKRISEHPLIKNEYTLCSPKLADMMRGLTPSDDLNGTIAVEGDIIHVIAEADSLFDSFVLAYHIYPQIMSELDEMTKICITYSDELTEMIRSMPAEDVPNGVTVAEGNKVIIRDIDKTIQSISADKYPKLRHSIIRLYTSGGNRLNAIDDCIIWVESREEILLPNDSIWSEKLEYSGRIDYTYYRCFLNDISVGLCSNQNAVSKLWVGMKHECGEDEFSIEREVRKLGDVRLDDLNEIHITGSCEQIATEAMLGCKNLQKAYIYSYNIQFPDDKVFPDGVTIITYKGSTAVPYANKYGYALELM